MLGGSINAERKEEFDMLARKDPYIENAYEHLQVIIRTEKNDWNMKRARERSETTTR